MKLNAKDIIRRLGLLPLEAEGGYFRETYRSSSMFKLNGSEGRNKSKAACTAIYYLLTPESFSHLHMLAQDEIFHFYLGDPAEMLLLYSDGKHEIKTLGNDILSGQYPQIVVPGKTWQGLILKPGGDFALLGTTVAPAFDRCDFFSAKDFYSEIALKFSDCIEIIKNYI